MFTCSLFMSLILIAIIIAVLVVHDAIVWQRTEEQQPELSQKPFNRNVYLSYT